MMHISRNQTTKEQQSIEEGSEARFALKNVDLTRLDWVNEDNESRAQQSFEYNGMTYRLEATSRVDSKTKIRNFLFVIISGNESVLLINMMVSDNGREIAVEDTIDRVDNRTIIDGRPRLPAGTGIEFYKKVLELIPVFVYQYQKPARHVIVATPGTNLTIEKWREKFEPILKERGYQKKEENYDEWEKIYKLKS